MEFSAAKCHDFREGRRWRGARLVPVWLANRDPASPPRHKLQKIPFKIRSTTLLWKKKKTFSNFSVSFSVEEDHRHHFSCFVALLDDGRTHNATTTTTSSGSSVCLFYLLSSHVPPLCHPSRLLIPPPDSHSWIPKHHRRRRLWISPWRESVQTNPSAMSSEGKKNTCTHTHTHIASIRSESKPKKRTKERGEAPAFPTLPPNQHPSLSPSLRPTCPPPLSPKIRSKGQQGCVGAKRRSRRRQEEELKLPRGGKEERGSAGKEGVDQINKKKKDGTKTKK